MCISYALLRQQVKVLCTIVRTGTVSLTHSLAGGATNYGVAGAKAAW